MSASRSINKSGGSSSGSARFVPASLRGYRRRWLRTDIVAGVTLAAVAIPETMGYTSIAEVPVVTGLYTVIFPTILFALLASSRLLVVGADSATAAILAAGLASLGIAGLTPNSPKWLAFTSLVALVCGGMLLIARLLKLGFLGDFLSASVLIGFLTGVGIQVFTGQIPDMLGTPKGQGTWFQQQWWTITHLTEANLPTVAFAVGALAVIIGFKKFLPKVPGAIIAVVVSIALSSALDVEQDGVAIVGDVQGGFPPLGLPTGISWSDVPAVLRTAVACFVIIVAQSAATSRSFAFKHGDTADINRDILGLSGANLAAGLSGTFVVNGSPTKTQILDEQNGHTQLANVTMSAVALLFPLFFTGLLTDMPTAVLAGIVFLIGVSLVDLPGLERLRNRRKNEFVVALITAVTVFAVGVKEGIILAVVLSLLDLVRRQYKPGDFVIGQDQAGNPTYLPAVPGTQSLPGLIGFRYDADLFYANATRFADPLESIIMAAPDPVRWVALDCGAIDDVDYSAGVTLGNLVQYCQAHKTPFVLAAPVAQLLATLRMYGTLEAIGDDIVFPTLDEAFRIYRAGSSVPGGDSRSGLDAP